MSSNEFRINDLIHAAEIPTATSFFILCLVLAAAVCSPAQSPSGTVRHHREEESDAWAALLTQAESDIERHDFAAAEPKLKTYLNTHPDDYSAWYYLGYTYHGTGKAEEAVAAYRKSVAAKPDVFESNLNLGLSLAETGQPDAEQFLRAAARLTPSSGIPAAGHARAWLALGRLLQATRPDEAITAFQQAATLDPKDPEPHLALGALLENERNFTEAELQYKQALGMAPESSDAMVALANLYMHLRRYDDAAGLLRKIIAQKPEDAAAHLQFGRMLAVAGKNEEAASELEAGIKLDPEDVKARRDLADLYSEMGKNEEAEKYYASLLASAPNDADLHHSFGRALLRQKQFARAEQELIRAVELKPDLGQAYGDLAAAANENKDYARAIWASDMRARYLPEIPISFFLRATAYDHLRDARQAARYYHQFLEVAGGQYPEQEWQAKHRLVAIEPKK